MIEVDHASTIADIKLFTSKFHCAYKQINKIYRFTSTDPFMGSVLDSNGRYAILPITSTRVPHVGVGSILLNTLSYHSLGKEYTISRLFDNLSMHHLKNFFGGYVGLSLPVSTSDWTLNLMTDLGRHWFRLLYGAAVLSPDSIRRMYPDAYNLFEQKLV